MVLTRLLSAQPLTPTHYGSEQIALRSAPQPQLTMVLTRLLYPQPLTPTHYGSDEIALRSAPIPNSLWF